MAKENGVFTEGEEYVWRGNMELNPRMHPQWRVKEGGGQPGSRMMQVEIRAPRALWDLPTLSATITVPASEAPAIEIDAEAAADALRPILGASVKVTVEDPQDG